ncbi:MAG: hypothetical protein IKT41_03970 [Clostridia bacterium]|nr:hypothetical protein [Clostridia bacterium]
MDMDMLKIVIAIVCGIFAIIVIAYFVLYKLMNKEDAKYARKLKRGNESNSFSSEVLYQKLYVIYFKIPFLKRYLIKLRRRLEIINVEDEYLTRKQASSAMTTALFIVIPLTIAIIVFTKSNSLLMMILLIFEVFIIETIITGRVDKIDDKLLKQQINFFAEIRHAYHEYNMVEEAIYQVAQTEEDEVSRQAEKIYEVLISDDPESELEKYYDIAPNSYLKEFAGISYLTKEFGDRTIDGSSLYLKNLNNITQEMQMEILKRDKLNYVFQSLSIISIIPILFLDILKNWAISQFSFTNSFYSGKDGFLVQTCILVLTFISFILVRKIKDNNPANTTVNTQNPWQKKVYDNPYAKKVVDLFIPKKGTKDYRKTVKLLKDSASKQKMEWLFINRMCLAVVAGIIALFVYTQLHRIAIDYIYKTPTSTSEYDIIGQMSELDLKKATALTEDDNYFIDKFKGKGKVKEEDVRKVLEVSENYEGATEEELATATTRITKKINEINTEYLTWVEVLVTIVFGFVGYMAPIWLLYFQAKMRELEMEDEVMQFQTIIQMLMKIERVNVEIILEWLERYSNIFKEPISKCVNNYESGAWEALNELKNDVTYYQFIRIVESLQAAVEKIPIRQAFDELDTERDYYQEKRKESNERLIARKGRIGKIIGFAPMVVLFVGYLIVPLVLIGMSSMTGAFNTMSSLQ